MWLLIVACSVAGLLLLTVALPLSVCPWLRLSICLCLIAGLELLTAVVGLRLLLPPLLLVRALRGLLPSLLLIRALRRLLPSLLVELAWRLRRTSISWRRGIACDDGVAFGLLRRRWSVQIIQSCAGTMC